LTHPFSSQRRRGRGAPGQATPELTRGVGRSRPVREAAVGQRCEGHGVVGERVAVVLVERVCVHNLRVDRVGLRQSLRGCLAGCVNDGQLAHDLLSPKRHVDKTYLAQVKGIMTQEDVETFAKGIPLKDFTCQPAKLEIVSVDSEKNQSQIRVTIAEGKFHQVKRMVAYCGKEVVDLQRLTMGTLVLDENLQRGEWRRLTKEELEALLANIA